ncbi:MAG: energy transducer TonB, partial [Mangrovicoccus sp.]
SEASQEALDSAEERILAKAVNDPILAQVPYEVDDPELQFRVANPLEEDQGEVEADEIPTEMQEDYNEVLAQASTAAAPAPSAGQDAQSGSEEEEIGLSDEEKARISKWQQDLVLALAQAKTYPKAARKAKAQGKVTVVFTLDSYGRIVTRKVSESSGWPVLDKAALDLLDGFERLPAPPAAMGKGPFDLRFPISYALV